MALRRKDLPAGMGHCGIVEEIADTVLETVKNTLSHIPERPWIVSGVVVPAPAGAPTPTATKPVPKVLQFEGGFAVTEQDIASEQELRLRTFWSDDYNRRIAEEPTTALIKGLVFEALHTIANAAPTLTESDLQIWAFDKRGSNLYAQRDFALGELFLVPTPLEATGAIEKLSLIHI